MKKLFSRLLNPMDFFQPTLVRRVIWGIRDGEITVETAVSEEYKVKFVIAANGEEFRITRYKDFPGVTYTVSTNIRFLPKFSRRAIFNACAAAHNARVDQADTQRAREGKAALSKLLQGGSACD